MPEGDSVYRTAARVRPVLEGHVLTLSEFRVPGFANVSLVDQEVTEVRAHGKHLLFTVGQRVIWSHLKMEGHWDVYRPGARWRAPAFKARAVLETAAGQAVGFELGFVRVLPVDEVAGRLAGLGPDPLSSWDPAQAVANIRAQGERPIAVALLDQRVLAGLGTIYRCESLFLAGVHPWTHAGNLTEVAATRIVERAARLLQLNKDRSRRSTTGSAGGPASWVYSRGGKPCLRCRTAVAYATMGDPLLLHDYVGGEGVEPVERGIYWCPSCQPE